MSGISASYWRSGNPFQEHGLRVVITALPFRILWDSIHKNKSTLRPPTIANIFVHQPDKLRDVGMN